MVLKSKFRTEVITRESKKHKEQYFEHVLESQSSSHEKVLVDTKQYLLVHQNPIKDLQLKRNGDPSKETHQASLKQVELY